MRRTATISLMHHVYILKCSDDSYYIGSTHNLERRFAEHKLGLIEGYTKSRRPVEIVWSTDFPTEHEAFLCERQVKGWTRAKKEALIKDDWDAIREIVKHERVRRESKHRKSK